MDALFREQQAFEEKLLKGGPHSAAVGAFEGAQLPAAGPVPLADRLHHVHAQPCGILRGVPAGDWRIIDLYSKYGGCDAAT